MINVMEFGKFKALIMYDPEIQMMRGEFINLNGGADFYAADVESLKREGEISLKVFLEECERRGIAPTKAYSGHFVLRTTKETHEAAAIKAASNGLSLNQWASKVIGEAAFA